MGLKQLGILHPGSMGASVGAAANNTGASVCWASEHRSEKTATRAEVATFKDLKTVANLVCNTEIIISVCPPSAATTVAEEVARYGFQGIYVDANAVSPARAQRIGTIVQSAGAKFVDGGIVGEPAWKTGTTRLYLCGSQAPLVSECFRGSNLEPLIIDAPPGAASALKMAYAAYTKGTTALLTAVLAVAEHEGVGSHLQHEWSLSQTTLSREAVARVCKTRSKPGGLKAKCERLRPRSLQRDCPVVFTTRHQRFSEDCRISKVLRKLPAWKRWWSVC